MIVRPAIKPVKIGIDAMGGDHAPTSVMRAMRLAMERHPFAHFCVYGDAAELEKLSAVYKLDTERLTLRHYPRALSPSDGPRELLSKAEPSSMAAAIRGLKAGEVEAVVSAGSTAALLALGKHELGMIQGIDRPAIVTFIPTLKNETVLLDLGANLVNTPQQLVQFALMGSAYCQAVLAVREPRVALLNVGMEAEKGTDLLKETARLLAETELPGTYVGFVEGDDLGKGEVDVVVTDGFTGNVALKVMEGTANMIAGYTRAAFAKSFAAKLGYFFAGRQFRKVRERLDPRRYNGAMMLGMNGVLVKSHGGADALAFANAVDIAADLLSQDLMGRVARYLPQTPP